MKNALTPETCRKRPSMPDGGGNRSGSIGRKRRIPKRLQE
jgi:hypothetical protein